LIHSRLFVLISLFLFAILTLWSAPYLGLADSLNDGMRTHIVEHLRWPRTLLAFIVGAGLAICGLVYQSLFHNPLATPFTLGISSGAALGAALAVFYGFTFSILGLSSTTLFAFVMALLTMAFIYRLNRSNASSANLLLSGIAVSFFFSSLILLIQFLNDMPDAYRLLRWLMGNLAIVGYGAIWTLAPIVLLTLLIVFYFSRALNLLMSGEELAQSRGVALEQVRFILFVATSLCIGALISVCGPIGFVGMMVPHICRLLIGTDHRWLIPASSLFGGGFLVACDAIGRLALAPTELPVGIITTLLGGPFFLWLLIRNRTSLL